MKILGGELRGRSFSQPDSRGVRPLSDKVRGAIFNVYGDVTGATVLDVYAGSGAAGFEAVSRGAAMVEAIEANDKVARIIRQNATELGLDWGYAVHQLTVGAWLARPDNESAPRYGLIIADPPYAQLEADILERLVGYLEPAGILVVSQSSKQPHAKLDGAELVKTKEYGDTALGFYRRIV